MSVHNTELGAQRVSTAPNADRIAELEAKVRSLESFENGAVERIARLERNGEDDRNLLRRLIRALTT